MWRILLASNNFFVQNDRSKALRTWPNQNFIGLYLFFTKINNIHLFKLIEYNQYNANLKSLQTKRINL